MKIAQILAPLHSLGPGERLGLWTQGCSKNCPGCISQQFRPFTGPEVSERELAALISFTAEKNGLSGLSISGGDPLEQAPALLKLLKLLRPQFGDILLYTGFTLSMIKNLEAGPEALECLEYIDVLIDGPYIEALNFRDCVLRGSENQQIYFLNSALKRGYESYMAQGRQLQCFRRGGELIVSGILNREADNG